MNALQAQSSILPAALHQLLSRGAPAFLLDVRTPGEFAGVHVPGATCIPLDELTPATLGGRRGPDETPVYVLCQGGGRAQRAVARMEQAGVRGCVLVEGGTQAWIDAGLPVERGSRKVRPLMQQVQITVGVISAAGAALALSSNPLFAIIPLFMGCGLIFAGTTGICGLAMLLAKMPWNRGCACGTCSK